jgi:hypothetical protein
VASTPAAAERERRSQAARAAGVAAARRLGLTVTDPTVLADLFSVVVHLRPAPVVARVSTWTAEVRDPISDSIARDLAVGSWLHGRGVPVAPPSGELPPGPHVEDGFGLSFWTYVEPDPDAEAVSATTQASMLRELHTEMAGFPGDLPGLELVGGDIRAGLDALGRHGDVLDAVATATLTRAAHELLPLTGDPGVPVLPVHGDAHPNNLVVGRAGPVWIDFEEACRAPAEWDLAYLHWGDPHAVRTGFGEVDPEAMQTFARLRAVHLACFLLAFRHAFGDTESWDDSIRMFVSLL